MKRRNRLILNSLFHSLNAEKQARIINAALKEFAQSGFKKASTNKIVKGATISKGSLFNYFRNKKDLYLYLIQHSVKVVEQIYEQIDLHETDLFKRIEKLGLKKLQIQRKFPQVFDFLTSIVREEADEVKDDIERMVNDIYKDGFKKLYQNIDYSKFREDIDIEKAIEILNWTMFGFADKAIRQLDTFGDVREQYIKEWEGYAKILKYSFYDCEEKR